MLSILCGIHFFLPKTWILQLRRTKAYEGITPSPITKDYSPPSRGHFVQWEMWNWLALLLNHSLPLLYSNNTQLESIWIISFFNTNAWHAFEVPMLRRGAIPFEPFLTGPTLKPCNRLDSWWKEHSCVSSHLSIDRVIWNSQSLKAKLLPWRGYIVGTPSPRWWTTLFTAILRHLEPFSRIDTLPLWRKGNPPYKLVSKCFLTHSHQDKALLENILFCKARSLQSHGVWVDWVILRSVKSSLLLTSQVSLTLHPTLLLIVVKSLSRIID